MPLQSDPFGAEPLVQAFNQKHRAMLTTCSSVGHRDIAAVIVF